MQWAIVTPLANEEESFHSFIRALTVQLNENEGGTVFLIVDRASTDTTPQLCAQLSSADKRFVTVWAPENKNVVDAYIRGYKEALKTNADYIIEIDSGMSHDPAEIPKFLKWLQEGYMCVYGSRFTEGGSMEDAPANRLILSKGGTIFANLLLGTRLTDMTSGFQGFHRDIVKKFCRYKLRSVAHFYQTELKYILRKYPSIEIPIHYKAPSPRVSNKAIINSLTSLIYYFGKRLTFHPISI